LKKSGLDSSLCPRANRHGPLRKKGNKHYRYRGIGHALQADQNQIEDEIHLRTHK